MREGDRGRKEGECNGEEVVSTLIAPPLFALFAHYTPHYTTSMLYTLAPPLLHYSPTLPKYTPHYTTNNTLYFSSTPLTVFAHYTLLLWPPYTECM